MKRGYIQGIGVIVSIAFAIIMSTAGRIESNEEIEAQQQATLVKKEEEKLQYVSEPIKLTTENGNNIETVSFENDEPENPLIVTGNDQKIYFEFKVTPINDKSLDDINLDNIRLNSDSAYIRLGYTSIDEVDPDNGIIKGNADVQLSKYYSNGKNIFKLSLVSAEENIKATETEFIISHIDVPSTTSTDSSNREDVNSTVTNEENTQPESLKDKKITGENIDDWEGILDEDEIEDYSFYEGTY